MSRIYDNKALSAQPVDNIEWKGSWLPDYYIQGAGVLVEGIIKSRSKHAVVDLSKKIRYAAIHVAVAKAHRRRFTTTGLEVEPNLSETEKVRTGFLNSSYKTVAKGCDDTLSVADLVKLIQPAELLQVTYRHNVHDCVVLWIEELSLAGTELNIGDSVRVRTRGNSLFVETIAKIEVDSSSTTVRNYSGGEQVGTSWTDKIMAVKKACVSEEKNQSLGAAQTGDCAADDEWGD